MAGLRPIQKILLRSLRSTPATPALSRHAFIRDHSWPQDSTALQRHASFLAPGAGTSKPPVDPFALVADELAGITDRMRKMVVSEIPKLATAAEYFFLTGAHGKRFRPTVLLLMASSLGYKSPITPAPPFPGTFPGGISPNLPMAAAAAAAATAATAASAAASVASKAFGKISQVPSHLERITGLPTTPMPPLPPIPGLPPELDSIEAIRLWQRQRQRTVAEITEMIHVASLLHDDVLDQADTRRGVKSLNLAMGNKLAVLAGDFLLARSSCALAGLRNTEVVELLSTVLEHLVSGEIMQASAERKDDVSMEYYLRKTFLKTASLMAHSCKAVAVLGGHNPDTCENAYDYGRHLGLAFQLVDDALDYSGTSAGLGKPALNDIRQGLVTAPVLFALEKHPHLKQLVDRRFKSPGDVDTVSTVTLLLCSLKAAPAQAVLFLENP